MKLRACPICGSQNIALIQDMGLYQASCISDICTLKSNLYHCQQEAIEGWNRIDKYDGVYDPNIIMNEESEHYFDLILKLKG